MDANLFHQSDAIEVRRVLNRGKGGRGVFARRPIRKDEIFERVPVILIPRGQIFASDPKDQDPSRISWYVFNWIQCKRDYVALSLGYGSIYNHSESSNAKYQMHPPDIMEFLATRDIAAGEEIYIDYRGNGAKAADVGFEISEKPALAAPESEQED